ncbi:hypothetical protein C4577_03195 [Candidatus Parcubacteria bacterium]|nr:MAG: hypothetical protein C4577_03195 [Candidatus Parcubacteria bacterium]
MTKSNTKTNPEVITSLPPSQGGTGAEVQELQPATIGGSIKPPKYQQEGLLQIMKDNWHLVLVLIAAISFFLYQVWTPLIELKQRVGVLEKTVDKNSEFIEEVKRGNYFNKFQNETFPGTSAQPNSPQPSVTQ